MTWYVLSAFLIVLVCYIPLPLVWTQIIRNSQKKKAITQKTIYLTFDDGPGNRLTPQILKILNEKGIKATFFILSRNISGREAILKSIVAGGHLVASHSYSHCNAWKFSPFKLIRDIQKGVQTLQDALSDADTKYCFRPPCGRVNGLTLLYLWFHRMPVILWTIDCQDTWGDDSRDPLCVARQIEEDKGGIVLFHDFDRKTDYLDGYILGSLHAAVRKAEELGLAFSTVDKL